MNLTDFHAKYFAHELTKRSPSDSVEMLAGVLADAQVDLNPHQIDAALFAFRNPFSRGAILADEVGLGKTIEAGLLLAQRWAERKRKLLVILPANLRKQWSQELADKFHLPSVILETRTFNEAIRAGNLNPFSQSEIVLCSYQFARSKEPYVRQVAWDLVVIDEAHRLRNVYKTSSRIALAIKQAVRPFPKLLLTATPLQNSLLELYGLVSIIDDFAFGDLNSFRARFARISLDFSELKERLRPICKRTLRRQVLEYVSYTDRHALVQEFVPSPDEQKLYDLVSNYLQRPTLFALPAGQRQLMTLILRKLLASSTYAISGTLDGLAKKLESAAASAEAVDAPPEELPDNLEEFNELADEWEEDSELRADRPDLTLDQLTQLRVELEQLRQFRQLAASIMKNSKGEVLLAALRRGFAAAAKAQEKEGAKLQQKAVIFTESRRTQEYLLRILEQTEFKGKVMIFNGVNNDPASKAIYKKWLETHTGTDRVTGSPTADLRAALVDHFRDEASILIATEAAAEGINLQFCNLVVNYDLPWNPQRIEQRIGRCHRYGQKFDVVVVNFLNKTNAADQRVYQLLDQKFRLFDGVFGASDEVLGAVESGVDFEKRIAAIYQKCRSPEQIEFEFDQLQKELETDIAEGQQDAREKLLNNFDQEVIEKVRVQSHNVLDRFNRLLWLMTRHVLADCASFQEPDYSFMLHKNPFSAETIHPGPYGIGKKIEDVNTYRVGHPLAQRVLDRAKAASTPVSELTFHLTGSGKNVAILVPKAKFSNADNDTRGPWMSRSLLGLATKAQRPNLHYPITDPTTGHVFYPPEDTGWRYAKERMQGLIDSGCILFPAKPDGRPREKKFRADLQTEFVAFPSIIDDVFTGDGTAEIREFFGEEVFDFSKPSALIKRLVKQGSGDNAIILDFFAGSGSTAQAVMELNMEENSTRKLILVQLPERTGRADYPTISEITKERVRRVIKKLNTDDGAKLALQGSTERDRGFQVFKLAESNFKTWDADKPRDMQKLEQQLEMHVDHLCEGRTASDFLYELLLKSGFPLTASVKKLSVAGVDVFSVAEGALLICLERKLSLEAVRAMAEKKPERVVCLDEGFAGNDQLKTNAVQTFKAKGVVFRTV